MRYFKVHIAAVSKVLPPRVISSAAVEERLAPAYTKLFMPQGQLEALTGIETRRFWEPGARLSHKAADAAEDVLSRSAVDASEVDVLIYGSVCREYFEPATAVHVAAELENRGTRLGLKQGAYDISNACLGMLNGVIDVANRIELGQINGGLVVGCESAEEIVDLAIEKMLATPTLDTFRLSLATLTGGSGAAAILLTREDVSGESGKLLGGVIKSAPKHHELCLWGMRPVSSAIAETRVTNQHLRQQFMETDAIAVKKHGIELGLATWDELAVELSDDGKDGLHFDRTICHQVGSANRQEMLSLLGLHQGNDFVSFDKMGNTGSVALPLALAQALESHFIKKGDRVGMLGIGSGLNCMMLAAQW